MNSWLNDTGSINTGRAGRGSKLNLGFRIEKNQMCMSAVGSMKIFKGGLVQLVHKPVGELREKHEKL